MVDAKRYTSRFVPEIIRSFSKFEDYFAETLYCAVNLCLFANQSGLLVSSYDVCNFFAVIENIASSSLAESPFTET